MTPTPTNTPSEPACTPIRPQPRVLIVEDDPNSHKTLSLLLQHYQFEILPARSVREAVALLDKSPQFILLDLILTDGDGTRVLQEVRGRKLEAKVFVITGTDDSTVLARVQRQMPQAILKKPLNFYALLQQMNDHRAA